tara:strand:- start:100 stop:918 length:819 start_codon:yes stop_codon:yes gene_type:complete
MKLSKNCQIIAEIGWNHMGNMSLAKKMILAAKKSGADFAKFQTWSVKTLKSGPWDKDGRIQIYKKAELTPEKHKILIKFCKKNKIKFLTSVFNVKDVSWLKKLGLSTIKIPSPEMHNQKLLDAVDGGFENVIVSTGTATWKEIRNVKKSIKKSKLTLLHCVSAYPASENNINLPKILELKKINKSVGYSGHLHGNNDAIAALNYDIEIIEKHFTINNNLPGRDNKFALLPSEMKFLVDYKNSLKEMTIYKGKKFQKVESDMRKNYRGRWENN